MALVVPNVHLDGSRPPVELPEGITTASVAEDCRAALLAFLEGTRAGWGKSGLAVWLSGPYRLVTRHAPRPERTPRRSDVAPASTRTQLQARTLDEILASARQEVLTTLKLARENGAFARSALHADFATRSRDTLLYAGYVPVDHERMRLADRVLSLAAVDYLMRPSDYLALLTVCTECDEVTFDPHVRARGLCRLHAPSLRRIALKSAG
jgi:hypothetical protein